MSNKVSPPPTVRLCQFRSVQVLEDHILVQSWRIDAMPPGAEEFIDYVTKEVFNNTYADTLFNPTGLDEDLDAFAEDEHEAQFETDELSDDQIVEYFLARGLDFRDGRGHPIRSTIFIARQAEAAMKGIAGRLPLVEELQRQRWEERLKHDAATYLKGRGRG